MDVETNLFVWPPFKRFQCWRLKASYLNVAEFNAAKSMTFKDSNFNLLYRGHKQGKRIGDFHLSFQQTSPYFLPVVKLFC
jgi:hypothetical protein